MQNVYVNRDIQHQNISVALVNDVYPAGWERYLVEKGESIFIRENKLISIMKKVWANKNIEKDSFETIVSSMKPYGLRGDFFKDPLKYGLPKIKTVESSGDLRMLGLDGLKRVYRYIPQDYPLPKRELLFNYKIFKNIIKIFVYIKNYY